MCRAFPKDNLELHNDIAENMQLPSDFYECTRRPCLELILSKLSESDYCSRRQCNLLELHSMTLELLISALKLQNLYRTARQGKPWTFESTKRDTRNYWSLNLIPEDMSLCDCFFNNENLFHGVIAIQVREQQHTYVEFNHNQWIIKLEEWSNGGNSSGSIKVKKNTD